MGINQLLTGANFTFGKRIRSDPRLTAGSLLMIDTRRIPTGVPANNSSIENTAWKEAAALIGSGDATTLAATFLNNFTSGEGVFERTAAGSLHGVVSRSAQGGHRAIIRAAAATEAYAAANTAHEYALIAWGTVTRAALNDTNMRDWAVGNLAAMSLNNLFDGGFANATGRQRVPVRKVGWTGSPNGTASLNTISIQWGNTSAYDSLNPNDGRSFVLDCFHIIDVTASGQSYDDINAADAALALDFYGEGGAYYDDSWTAPGSLIAS